MPLFSMHALFICRLSHADYTQSLPVFCSTLSSYALKHMLHTLSVTSSCSRSFFVDVAALSVFLFFFSSLGLLHLQSQDSLLCCVLSFVFSFWSFFLAFFVAFCAFSSAFFHLLFLCPFSFFHSSFFCFFSPPFLSLLFFIIFFCL